jgi:hypothetical protein
VKVATSPGSPLIAGLDRRLRLRGGASPAYIVEVTGQAEIEVVLYAASGTITFDLTSSAAPYNGVYAANVATLSTAPVGLAAAPLAGSGAVGTVVDAIPDLFVTAHADGLTARSYQWYSYLTASQTAAQATAIAGATAASHTVAAGDAGRSLIRGSRATDANGISAEIRSAAAVAVPGAPFEAAVVSSGQITSTAAGPYTLAGMAIGAADPGRVIYAIVQYGHQSTGLGLTGLTIGGTATGLVAQALSANSGCNVQIRKATVASGTTADVQVSMASAFRGCAVTLVRAVGATEGASASGSNATYAAVPLNVNLPAGGAVLAGGMLVNKGTTGAIAWTGVGAQSGFSPNGSKLTSSALYQAGAAETPRTVTMTPTGDGINDVAAVALVLQGA